MPISYTKRGWMNNSPPAINAANLGAMDDGLKNAIDALNNMGDAGQQAVKEIGEAPATTTGGKLVNKITEAGYSLAPATGTSNLDNIADGTSYKRVQAAKADKINGGTYSEDDIADGTSYARLQKAKADALNAETQVAPTAAGAADANAIAAAAGSTLGARLETLTGQAIKTTALTAGADWADITDNISNNAALHIIKMYDSSGYINLWIVGTSREGNAFVVSNTPTPHQTLSFQKILVDGATHKLQCKAPSFNTTITCKTILATP